MTQRDIRGLINKREQAIKAAEAKALETALELADDLRKALGGYGACEIGESGLAQLAENLIRAGWRK